MKHRPYLNRMTTIDDTLDARGLLCPLPVLRARKRLGAMAPGAMLRMIADDPAAIVDVPHYCNESGHTLVDHSAVDGILTFYIRRAAP